MSNYCKITEIRKNPLFESFVYRTLHSTPGTGIHDGKILKKKDKLKNLIDDVGYWGPILDLIIRGTINHLVINEFSNDVRAVTDVNGSLYILLMNYFSKDKTLWEGILNWFKHRKSVEDYEINFRNFRCELLNSQLSTILSRPQSKVST